MNLENIEVGKKELGKLVGLAKRSFTNAKTRTVKVVVDKIEDYENEYFAEDTELAKLVKAKQVLDKETKEQKKELDNQILERINTALRTKRGYDAEELYDKRETALLELLKDAEKELKGLYEDSEVLHLPTETVIERLGNMIKDMEGEI